MAKKVQTVFVCSECGHESLKWMGQCICGVWNTMTEEKVLPQEGTDKRRRTGSGGNSGAGAFSRAGKPMPLF